MSVTVIIPTLDEEEAIGKVLGDIPKGIIDEVIVVDSSSDGTAKIAESFGAKVILESRMEYGRALQSGVEKAEGEVIVYIDGDYSYDPRDIPRVVQPILSGKFDVVLGNRFKGVMLPGSMSFHNRFGNLVISIVFSVLLLRRVGDTQCGLRAIRKRILDGFSYHDYGMPYVTEQLIKLVRRGARVGIMPVNYRPRIGKTKLRAWADGFEILKVILRERFGKHR